MDDQDFEKIAVKYMSISILALKTKGRWQNGFSITKNTLWKPFFIHAEQVLLRLLNRFAGQIFPKL